jgi:hypothetical protein
MSGKVEFLSDREGFIDAEVILEWESFPTTEKFSGSSFRK